MTARILLETGKWASGDCLDQSLTSTQLQRPLPTHTHTHSAQVFTHWIPLWLHCVSVEQKGAHVHLLPEDCRGTLERWLDICCSSGEWMWAGNQLGRRRRQSSSGSTSGSMPARAQNGKRWMGILIKQPWKKAIVYATLERLMRLQLCHSVDAEGIQ